MNVRHVGTGVNISRGVVLPDNYWIGDHTFIGPGVKILNGPFFVGDYSKIHAGTFIYTQPDVFPGGFVALGHNTWIGQNAIIDGSGGLRAGDNLGVGIASHLYTHISNGDCLEGCRFHGAQPMHLGSDVWFVGCCLVSPITAGNKSMALLGSVLTHDMEDNHVYGGNPANDLTDKIGSPYRAQPPEDKWNELCVLRERFFASQSNEDLSSLDIVVSLDSPSCDVPGEKTRFDVTSRTYTKRGSLSEVEFMKWLVRFHARFTPAGEPSSQLIDEFLYQAREDSSGQSGSA